MSVKITSTDGLGKSALDNILKSASKLTAKVGWFPSAKYEDGTPVAQVAAQNEFGQHARPFIRPTIAAQQTAWTEQLKIEAKLIAEGKQNVKDTMEIIASIADGAFRKAISEVYSPPLSIVTLILRKKRRKGETVTGTTVGQVARDVAFVGPRQKKDKSLDYAGVSTKPLVDTRVMINTLTHTVEESI